MNSSTKIIFLALAALIAATPSFSQSRDSTAFTPSGNRPYRLNLKADIPILAGSAAIDLYNFAEISKKSNSSVAEVESLSTAKVDWFDRWAVHPYNKSADKLSYMPFYVAIPLPLIFEAIDGRMRRQFGTLTTLYAESMFLTGVLYTSAVHYVNRHRPLVYESGSPLGERTSSASRNSFFAGHVALVGTSVFFIANTWIATHPDASGRWFWWGGAEAVTALTAYLRNRAGEHFFSDVLLGNLVGVASGTLTPLLHRVRIKGKPVTISPWMGRGAGLTAFYSFN